MGQRSIRIPDELDRRIVELAKERQTSATEIVIWAVKKYFGVEEEFLARRDRRTVSGRVPVAETSRVKPQREPEVEVVKAIADAEVPPRVFRCPKATCPYVQAEPGKCQWHPNLTLIES